MTVMTSLMILILMTFAAAILESTSLQTSKNIRRADVERSVESVFAEYQKELLEEYDIFGLDGSYETGSYTEDRVLDRMTVFGAIAGENQIEAIRFLSDNEGQEFADQVCRYLENLYGIDMIQDLIGREDEAKEQEEKAIDFQKREEENEKKMDEVLASGGSLEESGEGSEGEIENPLGVLQKLKHRVLAEIVLPRDRVISQKSVEGMAGVSGRTRQEGKGNLPSVEANASEKLYLIAYIPDHFKSYTKAEDDRPLEYEQEYLIGGKQNDMENLQIVLNKIRRFRMAPNFLYLQTDETKKAEAKVLAGIVSALLGNPGLTEVVAQGVLMAWAYGESIMDLRVLTAGGKVPSVKTKETWKLSLSGLLKLGTTQDSGSSSAGSRSAWALAGCICTKSLHPYEWQIPAKLFQPSRYRGEDSAGRAGPGVPWGLPGIIIIAAPPLALALTYSFNCSVTNPLSSQ